MVLPIAPSDAPFLYMENSIAAEEVRIHDGCEVPSAKSLEAMLKSQTQQ